MTDRKEIEKLIEQELKEANKVYPLFHSPHEAFAVLLEEIEELAECVNAINEQIRMMWEMIKRDESIAEEKRKIHYWAIEATREAIQVSAMCDKITQSDLR